MFPLASAGILPGLGVSAGERAGNGVGSGAQVFSGTSGEQREGHRATTLLHLTHL